MGERWIDPQLDEDIIIKHNESANIVATSLFISLNRFKFHTVDLFFRPVSLFQIFYHSFITPSVGCHCHLDIQMDPPKVIRSPIYQQPKFDT